MFYGFEFIARKDAKEGEATVVRSWICLSQRRKDAKESEATVVRS
jgi:hypothetical protein